jgi:hypothetical protein
MVLSTALQTGLGACAVPTPIIVMRHLPVMPESHFPRHTGGAMAVGSTELRRGYARNAVAGRLNI